MSEGRLTSAKRQGVIALGDMPLLQALWNKQEAHGSSAQRVHMLGKCTAGVSLLYCCRGTATRSELGKAHTHSCLPPNSSPFSLKASQEPGTQLLNRKRGERQ